MTAFTPSDEPTRAPEPFRDALAVLVQVGVSVVRMLGQAAETERALAEAAMAVRVAEGVCALAETLAEAIEADRAIAAAAEARRSVVARAEAVAGAYARVARSVRLTVLLAERLERGWARRGGRDDRHAMARRQIARGVAEAIGREAEGERAVRLTEALADRLDRLDAEDDLGDRPAEEIIAAICRDLGLDPVRMVVSPVLRGRAAPPGDGGGERGWDGRVPWRRPDG